MFKHLGKWLHYPKTGKGQQISIFPWISTDFANFASPELMQTPGQLGTTWYDDFGNSFTVRRVGTGDWLQGCNTTWSGASGATANDPFRTDTVSTATVRVITLTTGGLTAGVEGAFPANMYGSWVYDFTMSANPNDKLKLIKSNTATTLTVANVDTRVSNLQNDADAYVVAPAGSDALTIIRPYVAVICPTAGATTALSSGIAVQAGVAGTWGFVQVDGLAMVLTVGTGTAIVAGGPVVPSGATAGYGIGAAAAAANQIGTSAVANASTVRLTPVWLSILGYS